MADNVTLNAMSGGSVVAADDIGSVYYQRIKLVHGADGVNDGDVSTVNGLPIDIRTDNVGLALEAGGNLATAVTHLATLAGAVSTEMQVDVVGALPAGTNAIGKLAANSGVDIGDVDVTSITGVTMSNAAMQITGDEAHDAVDAGNPVKMGGNAIAHGSNPTAVAAADRTNWYFNRHGIPFVITGHMNPITKQINVTAADGAQTDTALVTITTGQKIVVTGILVTADNANSVDVAVRVGFGTANTPANDASSGMIASHPGVPAGGGLAWGNGGGILGVGADNADLRLTCEVPTGGSIDVNAIYYIIES